MPPAPEITISQGGGVKSNTVTIMTDGSLKIDLSRNHYAGISDIA
jgi:hypothetical protein